MPPRRTSKTATAAAARPDPAVPVIGPGVKNPPWLRPIHSAGRLEPGQVPKQFVTVPGQEAQRVLRGIIRFVVDIPADTSTVLVWEKDGSELWVDVGTVSIVCLEGLVRIGVRVGCDQLDKPVVVTVPIGVGTAGSPTGLVMTTTDRLEGPDLIVARWSEAITAFAWEALVELARRLCAQLGKDKAGLALIPGAIAATRGALLVQPMARNDLTAFGR